jgi:uncharacterized protein
MTQTQCAASGDSQAMASSESLIEFPCEFPLKVMGLAGQDFDSLVVEIVRRHVAEIDDGAVRVKPSSAGKFVSLTVTVWVETKQQLEGLYTELSGHERVLMVL